MSHHELPAIEDAAELAISRTTEFKKKFEHLGLLSVGQAFSVEGQKTQWIYVIREFNKQTGKHVRIVNTVKGIQAKREA